MNEKQDLNYKLNRLEVIDINGTLKCQVEYLTYEQLKFVNYMNILNNMTFIYLYISLKKIYLLYMFIYNK